MNYTGIPVTPEEDEAFRLLAEDLALHAAARSCAEAIMEYIDELRDAGCGSEECPGCATLHLKIPKGRN
jgi:hypothetical protein